MTIRHASEDDLARIVAIYNQAVNEGAITTDLDEVTIEQKQAWFGLHDTERHPLFVIEDEGRVVGWCSLQPWQPGHEALAGAVVMNLFVDQENQRHGFGAALLEHVLGHAAGTGVTHIMIFLLEGNRPAARLLNKFGFRIWGHLPEIADFGPIYCGQNIYGKALKTRGSSAGDAIL